MNSALSEFYDFQLVGDAKIPFGGYISSEDKTKVTPAAIVRGSKNMYKKNTGTWANRFGLKRRGSADSTLAGVISSGVWNTSLGAVRPLRVQGGKLQVESDIVTDGTYVWYDLLTGLSDANSRFVFDTWWDDYQKKDVLIGVNHSDDMKVWTGGIALLLSSATVTTSISSIVQNANGTGYVVGDIVTISTGTGGQVVVTSIGGGGAVIGLSLINPGSGYTTNTNVATTGGTGTGLTVDLSVGSTYTLTKTGTTTWAEEGFTSSIAGDYESPTQKGSLSLLINGNTYAYKGGGDTTTLYGLTSDPSGEAANSVVLQTVRLYTDVPVADFMADFLRTVNNQVIVGSYTSRIGYISADIDCTDFENAGSYVPGDPDLVILDNLLTGIGVKEGNAWISAGRADWYKITLNQPVPISFTNPNESGARYIITKVEKRSGADGAAAYAHEFIDMMGDDIVFLSKDQQLRTISDTKDIPTERYPSLSLAVREELTEEDFTGGHLKTIGEFIHITAPVNGRDWMYQMRTDIDEDGTMKTERFWHPPQIRNVSRFDVIEGVTYGHSAANPQLYQIWDTSQWSDDSPDDEDLDYTCTLRMAYRNSGSRTDLIKFDKIFYEGYMTQGTPLYGNTYYDYQGSTELQKQTINTIEDPAKFFSATPAFPLGSSPLGDNPLGDGLTDESNDQELLPKFRKMKKVTIKDCFEYSIEVYSLDAGSRWEMICLGANVQLSSNKPVFLT